MKRSFQEMSERSLSSRAADYLVHAARSLGPSALVTETEEVCCVTATGKTGKKYISRASGAEQVHVLGLAHCALITSTASSFIFDVFDPSASEPISYQPIWRQSN